FAVAVIESLCGLRPSAPLRTPAIGIRAPRSRPCRSQRALHAYTGRLSRAERFPDGRIQTQEDRPRLLRRARYVRDPAVAEGALSRREAGRVRGGVGAGR